LGPLGPLKPLGPWRAFLTLPGITKVSQAAASGSLPPRSNLAGILIPSPDLWSWAQHVRLMPRRVTTSVIIIILILGHLRFNYTKITMFCQISRKMLIFRKNLTIKVVYVMIRMEIFIERR
jgi:hypothetical protein